MPDYKLHLNNDNLCKNRLSSKWKRLNNSGSVSHMLGNIKVSIFTIRYNIEYISVKHAVY